MATSDGSGDGITVANHNKSNLDKPRISNNGDAGCNERMHQGEARVNKEEGLWSWLQLNFFPLQIMLAYVFVMSGLIVCFLMLLAWIFVWPFNKKLYRKIVTDLVYLHWSQFTFIGQWWSGSNCSMVFENMEVFDKIGKEHTIVLMNHKYDIDWMMAWILAERMQMLGGTKIYGKQSLKFVPLLGWAWMFTESIFLKRSWDKDREIISRDLKYISDYPENYYVTLLLFCEGTRFTEAKHKKSLEFAELKGLPILKHHLLPRTRGFVHSINGLKGKVPSILDLTVAFKRGPEHPAPTMMNLVLGRKCDAVMYGRRISLSSIPTDTDEKCAEWLYNHFKEKDEIYDRFVRTGGFGGETFEIPRRVNDLITTIVWHILLDVPLFYYAVPALLAGSLTLKISVAAIVTIRYVIIRAMIGVSEIKTSSSEYGRHGEPVDESIKKSS